MRRTVRHVVVLLVPLTLSACAALTEPFIDRGQVDHVDVLAWPTVVEVGDTVSVTADGFNANGIGTAWLALRVWRVSDNSVINIRGSIPPAETVIVGGLRPGAARVFARIGDHEGSDSIRVIPRLAPIVFTPSVVSMRRGDSVFVVADIRSTAGDSVTGVTVRWNTTDIGIVRTGCCSAGTWLQSSTQFGSSGTTTVTATVGHATGILAVTVSP